MVNAVKAPYSGFRGLLANFPNKIKTTSDTLNKLTELQIL